MFGRIAIAGRCTPGRNAVLERWGKITQMERDHRFGSRDRSKSRGHVGSLSQLEASLPASTVGGSLSTL